MAWPKVLAAQAQPILYHYDPAFLEQFRRTERKVGQLFRTKQDILLMQGEAILGLEAAARGLVRPGHACLNLVSGLFGRYMGYWLRDFGAELHELEVGFDDAIDPAEVDRYLTEHPEIEFVSVVHSETPSGTLNPLAEIGPIAKKHGCLTFVDCVSSLGGMPVLPDEWSLDICVAGAQKCMAGPPGMSLMSVSEDAWKAIRENPSAPRGSFLSMLDWKEQWIDGEKFPFTPSVVDLYGVEAACDEILEHGLEESFAQHELAAKATREGVKGMGLSLWACREEITAACATAIKVPDGLDHQVVRDHCREHYGVMISGGQGAGNLVRIGHMGPTARSLYPIVGLSAVGRTFADLGVAGLGRSGCRGGARGALAVGGSRAGVTLAPFELHRPHSVEEATGLLDEHGEDALLYCGGTELLLIAKMGFTSFEHLVDTKAIPELAGIREDGDVLVLGATATHRQIERSELVLARLPALAAMERQVANVRVRTVGTLAGNLCFSDPHSDPATFLLALDAEVESRRGDGPVRRRPLHAFLGGPYEPVLEHGELVLAHPGARAALRPLDRAPEVRVPRAARRDRDVRGAGRRRHDRRRADLGRVGRQPRRARARGGGAPRRGTRGRRGLRSRPPHPAPPRSRARSRTRTDRPTTRPTSSRCSCGARSPRPPSPRSGRSSERGVPHLQMRRIGGVA